jgi:transposase
VSLSGIPVINTFDEARQCVAELSQKNVRLEAENEWLREQLRLQKHRQFGPSSETTPPGQETLDLFNEAEAIADTGEPAVEEITYTLPGKKRTRESLLRDLPYETIEHRLPEEEQVCPGCSGPLHEIGKESTYRIGVVPAQFTFENHVQFKYACRACARDTDAASSARENAEHFSATTLVIEAPMPRTAFPGSLASPSLVAYIVCQKYLEGLPLYRQQQALQRTGFELSRQTMANWVIAASLVLQPMWGRMKYLLLQHDILHADETTLQVLHETGREPQTKSYMWLYRTGRYPTDGPIVLYEYQRSRQGENARNFLGGWQGFLLTDGHSGYDKLPEDVANAGCWAHARRYFMEALAALPKGSVAVKGAKPTLAHTGLDFCNKLFAIESDLRDLSPVERHAARLVRSAPLLERLRVWLDASVDKALPKSLTGKAIGYCRNQWPKLIVFLQDGRLEIDNNRSERSIKPFVIGRKNWLFSNTPRGATASAVIYSIVETAKENGLNPFQYLTFLFENLPPSGTGEQIEQDFLDALMPWSKSLPTTCRVPVKPKSL